MKRRLKANDRIRYLREPRPQFYRDTPVMVYTLNPNREMELWDFKASLVSTANSRPVRAT